MKEPVLIIMAAGLGSRYGGLKQMDPVGTAGEIIMDFSVYDARKAGFRKVIFIIKREMKDDFESLLAVRKGRDIEAETVFQEMTDLPPGYEVPPGRIKPWGTCHAVMSCRDRIDGPFAVINADDFYGREAFEQMYGFLKTARDGDRYDYAMIGYRLENTLTEHGHVARGVCEVRDGMLREIRERTKIMRRDGAVAFTEDEEKTWTRIPEGSPVSMNFWGFTPSMMKEMTEGFPKELDRILKENPQKGEYLLPLAVDSLLKQEKARVRVLDSGDRWYGVTYADDKPAVEAALKQMKEEGRYPEKLWK